MSDLCYNCGSCHLGTYPTPCSKPLTECVICKNLGHQHVFCPKSVKILKPNHEYWAICHNCDQWHLPYPCQQDMVQCIRCWNYGHQPRYCPKDPLVLGQGGLVYAVNISQVHHELLRKIKFETCKDTIQLLENHSKEEVIDFMSRPILPPLQTVLAPAPARPAGFAQPPTGHFPQIGGHTQIRPASVQASPGPDVTDDSPFASKGVPAVFNPEDPRTSPNVPPTPTPTSAGGKLAANKHNHGHQTMRDGSGQDQMTKVEGPQQHGGSGDGVESQPPPKKAKISKPKANKAKSDKAKVDKPKAPRRPPQPRCADCKKKHKRCDHGPQGKVDNGSGHSQSPQLVQTPNDAMTPADRTEHHTGTPGLTDAQQSPVVTLPVPQSGQSGWDAAETEIDMGALNGTDDPITQEQQDVLRAAVATMPPAFHQLATHTTPLFQGNFNQMEWLARSTQHAMSGEHGVGSIVPAHENQVPISEGQFNPGFEQGGQMVGFRPHHDVFQSNDHSFMPTGQGQEMQQPPPNGGQPASFNRTQMLAPEIDGMLDDNHRVIAPNHHNSEASIFAFDDNGQVVESVEDQTAQSTTNEGEVSTQVEGEAAGTSNTKAKKSGGGRKRKADE